MDTPDDYLFHPMWVPVDRVSHITFRVKAKSDGHIYLAESYASANSDAYEISLGAWTNNR